MRQFSLKEFLADPSQKVVSRLGFPVRIISTNFKGKEDHPVIGIVEIENIEMLQFFSEAGRVLGSADCDDDLFFLPSNHTAYVSLHRKSDGTLTCGDVGFDEEVIARWGARRTDYVATATIVWEE
jgi:hypothetical protein